MEDIKLDVDSWKFKTVERSRGRMKLQIKLSKEEAQAFKNFTEMVKPPEINESDFLKGIFKIGVETMEIKLMEAVQRHAEENDLDLSSVGLPDSVENQEPEKEDLPVTVMGEMSNLSDKPSDTKE